MTPFGRDTHMFVAQKIYIMACLSWPHQSTTSRNYRLSFAAIFFFSKIHIFSSFTLALVPYLFISVLRIPENWCFYITPCRWRAALHNNNPNETWNSFISKKKRKEKEIHLRAVNCITFDFQSDVLFSMSLFQSNRRIRDTFRYVVKQLAISIRCCPSLNIRMSGTEWRDASVGIFQRSRWHSLAQRANNGQWGKCCAYF